MNSWSEQLRRLTGQSRRDSGEAHRPIIDGDLQAHLSSLNEPEGSPKLQHEAFGEIPSNAAHNESSRDLPPENELSWTAGAEVSYDTQWGDEEGAQSWSEATPQQGVRSDSHFPSPEPAEAPPAPVEEVGEPIDGKPGFGEGFPPSEAGGNPADAHSGEEDRSNLKPVTEQLAVIGSRLDTMNAVLRGQVEELHALSDRRWFGQLSPLAAKLATIHDGICSDLARLQEDPAEASGDFFSTLDFLQDAIAEVLHSMGVEIIEVAAGTRYDSEVHRRTKLVDVDDPALHRTVAPSRRSAHFYRFNLPEPPPRGIQSGCRRIPPHRQLMDLASVGCNQNHHR